jgi:prepilin-type N-terminal cleavage/methylation domain-containing protein
VDFPALNCGFLALPKTLQTRRLDNSATMFEHASLPNSRFTFWLPPVIFNRVLSSPASTQHFCSSALEKKRSLSSRRCSIAFPKRSFTLLELLVVVSIIAILLVLIAPAFTSIKTAADLTNAAYTVKGLLEQARTYSIINNTYTWIGFFEENGAVYPTNPATAGTGRVVISIVASRDGAIVYQQPVNNPSVAMDPTRLVQVIRLIRLDNVHLRTFANGTGTGDADKFPIRPPIPGNFSDNAKIGDTSPPDSLRPFQYPVGDASTPAQYTFVKMIEFSPQGEARVNNNNYTIRALLEIGLQPVRQVIRDDNKDCAVQITGFSGNIKVYQP